MQYAAAVTLRALLLSCALLGVACGDEADPRRHTGRGPAESVSQRDALLGGDTSALLAVLARSHADVRETIGPHALRVRATLSLKPTRPGRPNPAVDSAVARPQTVTDRVDLRWDEPDDAGPRFALEQHNDHDRGRSVVVTDGTLYAKLEHRPWTFHPVESEVHELWLDDAQRAAHDAVEFLQPGATVSTEVVSGAGWNGGDAVRITLAPGDGSAAAPGTEGWRAGVAFSALAATLLVDAESGAWLSLDATATYTVEGGAAGPLAGQFEVHGAVAPTLDEAPAVAVPQGAVALPERHRYEEERKRLLDGLAAP